jgi:hypothetical protein
MPTLTLAIQREAFAMLAAPASRRKFIGGELMAFSEATLERLALG